MSSWANIRIPRKRNISQIPAELRPQIISRANRVEVLASEAYHTTPHNEVIKSNEKTVSDKSNNNTINNNKANYENPRQYITKKIESNVNPAAFELKYNDKSYVFIILRHIRNIRDNDLWISSYNSIRRFYTNKIIIIDDNSTINTLNGKLINTEVIKSEFPGAGEILPYYYFLKNKWADKMVFLHDSMFINRPFRDSELEGDIKFHWHFTPNSFDDTRKISNYISMFKNNKEIQAFANNPNNKWLGCFGGAAIVDYTPIEYLEDEYNIFTQLALSIKTRKDREAFERVLGIILYYDEIVKDNCSNFGDITKYPEAFQSENNNMESASYILGQKGYDTAIIKVWRGR